MLWTTNYYSLPRFKYASCNQYGTRFKRKASKTIIVARLECKTSESDGVQKLVLLSHSLNVPVHYDFKDNTAYIEVMGADAVRQA